jgi:uncharacterized membrane-anchored protein
VLVRRASPGADDSAQAESNGRTITGSARLGKRTKHLVKRLRPGEIAVIDHADLDRVSGEDLIACGVVGVVNQAPSSTGSYPNMGPLLLVQAGVHLIDEPDADLFETLSDGDLVELRGGEILRNGNVVARGTVRDPRDVQAANERRSGRCAAARSSWSMPIPTARLRAASGSRSSASRTR